MSTNQEQSEQIERYIAGEMPEAERQAFEAEIERDPALAEALALHRALRQSLGNRPRMHLLDALADVVGQEDKRRPAPALKWFSPFRLAAAVLVLIAAIGTWLYFHPGNQAPATAETPAPQSAPAPLPDSALIAPAPAPAERPPESAPLAAADRKAFEPNRTLDPLVGTYVRGGASDIMVTRPKNDAVFVVNNGTINFAIAGKIGKATALTLHIYNNREADFAAGKPVYQTEIPTEQQAFALNAELRLAPGRYYAVLSEPGDEEPVMVLRFYAESR